MLLSLRLGVVLRWGIPLGREEVDRLDLFLERPLFAIISVVDVYLDDDIDGMLRQLLW